jgi:hypothetical protein
MNQRGVVLHHEHRIGYVIIRDEFGNHTVVKLLTGSDIERGDMSLLVSCMVKATKPS